MKKTAPLDSQIRDQLKDRKNSTLAPLLKKDLENATAYFMCSPDDRGVMRNGGRKGARFAPEAITCAFSLMQNHSDIDFKALCLIELKARADFEVDQKNDALTWNNYWKKNLGNPTIHLGGGHDHIYPLLAGLDQALCKNSDKRGVCVLNLDAHLDTRTDKLSHSGTPFRNAARSFSRPLHMIQWGIHRSANSMSTTAALPAPHKTTLIKLEETLALSNPLQKILELKGEDHLIISLDADVLDGSFMRAVSAVNARGLSSEHVFELIQGLAHDSLALGIYEYNPIFDDLSNYGARMLGKLALSYLESKLA